MHHTTRYFLFLLSPVLLIGSVPAQTVAVPMTAEVAPPIAWCTLAIERDLEMGSYPRTGAYPTQGLFLSGSPDEVPSPGMFSLSGIGHQHSIVTIDFPAALHSEDGGTLPFSGYWYHADGTSRQYVQPPVWNITTQASSQFTHRFLVSGSATSSLQTATPGTYTGTITITALCQ